jgi:hypothetical protein
MPETLMSKTALIDALKKFDLEKVQKIPDPDVPGKDGRTVREIASRKRDKRYFKALSARR